MSNRATRAHPQGIPQDHLGVGPLHLGGPGSPSSSLSNPVHGIHLTEEEPMGNEGEGDSPLTVPNSGADEDHQSSHTLRPCELCQHDHHQGSRCPSPADSPREPTGMDIQLAKSLSMLADSQSTILKLLARQEDRPVRPQSAKEPKVKDPDVFDGRRNGLAPFLSQCQLVFGLNSSRFPTDDIKIKYVIGYCRGAPLNAIRTYLNEPVWKQPEWLRDYNTFVEYLQRNYGDPDERGTAERKLSSLVQKGSASEYFAEFQTYAAILGWPDAPLVSLAVRGLKEELKDQLALQGARPETMADLVEFVVRVDNRLYARGQERRRERDQKTSDNNSSSNPQRTSNQSRSSDNSSSRSSFVRSTNNLERNRNTNTQSSQAPRKDNAPVIPRKLSEQDKQYRRDNGLCLYCGQAGHLANACPSRPPQASFTMNTPVTVSGPSKVSAPPK